MAPGALQTLTVNWANPIFADDFYRVEVTLKDQAGTAIDKLCNGFSIWKEDVIQNGVNFIYDDNYIRIKQSDGSYKAFSPRARTTAPTCLSIRARPGCSGRRILSSGRTPASISMKTCSSIRFTSHGFGSLPIRRKQKNITAR